MAAGRDGRMGRQIGSQTLGGRKVRAPQDTVVGNAHRPNWSGKVQQKANRLAGMPRAVRVKR